MISLIGAVLVVSASVGIGFLLSDSVRERVRTLDEMARFVEHILVNIQIYKTPLQEIYASFESRLFERTDFLQRLGDGCGIFDAAKDAGLLRGDDECEIIKAFGERIGGGCAEDMEKLCTYTASRLRQVSDKLRAELPDKQRIYRTISVLAGVSVIVMFL